MELNKLYHGDCMEIMKSVEDKSVDMVLCDLPYGVTQNPWDTVLPISQLWDSYNRIIKDNGAIVLFGQGLFSAELMTSNKKMWRYNLVWDKIIAGGFLNANRMPMRIHEDIMVFYKNPPVYNPQKTQGSQNHSKGKNLNKTNNNYGDFRAVDNAKLQGDLKFPSSIITIQKVHPSKSLHPTEKPVPLMEILIKTYTNPGATVLDNCIGSGTTAIACLNTGRNFIGIEKDLEIYNTAQTRVQNHIIPTIPDIDSLI